MSQFTPTLAVSSLLFSAGLETQRNLFLTIEHNLSLNQPLFKKGETSCTENYRKIPLMQWRHWIFILTIGGLFLLVLCTSYRLGTRMHTDLNAADLLKSERAAECEE